MANTAVKTTIIGYVVRDPETRYLPDGTAVCNLTVSTKKSKAKTQNGQPTDKPKGWGEYGEYWQQTIFHRCTAWRKTAETLNNYVRKGDLILLSVEPHGEANEERGTLEPRVWSGEDGVPRANFEWTIRSFNFMERPGNGDSSSSGSAPPDIEDSLPF